MNPFIVLQISINVLLEQSKLSLTTSAEYQVNTTDDFKEIYENNK